MKKIPSLFQRNHDGDRQCRDEITPGCEWVVAGEGVATRKWDGTSVMIRSGVMFKRREIKPGNNPGFRYPDGWISCGPVDPETGKEFGWIPVDDSPGDKWHRKAVADIKKVAMPDGTYELVGPHVQGGIDGVDAECLMLHGGDVVDGCPAIRTFSTIREWLRGLDLEGVVFHNPDGRMAKVKKKDFGLPRKAFTVET